MAKGNNVEQRGVANGPILAVLSVPKVHFVEPNIGGTQSTNARELRAHSALSYMLATRSALFLNLISKCLPLHCRLQWLDK